ncbi:unnamed protein product [Angiostrongylus costaricensis]|uniref:HAP1 N-terminal domain-containing protein n=1 Tax=Angiostrongylus costaricensis TaxID=334426 RepID=A0A0R3PVA9_ANGCS|nr:unnamed protein product [Angiostrongylus costaricensis]
MENHCSLRSHVKSGLHSHHTNQEFSCSELEDDVLRDDVHQTRARLCEIERRINELETELRLNNKWRQFSSNEQAIDDMMSIQSHNFNLWSQNLALKESLRNLTEENRLLRESFIQMQVNITLLEKERHELKAHLECDTVIKGDLKAQTNSASIEPATLATESNLRTKKAMIETSSSACQNMVDLRMSHAVGRLSCPAAAFFLLEKRVSMEQAC